jgi:hypothetical protein
MVDAWGRSVAAAVVLLGVVGRASADAPMVVTPGAPAATTRAIVAGLPLNAIAWNAALSAAVLTTTGGPATPSDRIRLLADWDGREDLTADHEAVIRDNTSAGNPATDFFTRGAVLHITGANGMPYDAFVSGDSVGNVRASFDVTNDLVEDVAFTFNVPQLVNTGTSTGFTLSNPIIGDATSPSVVVTGVVVNPVVDMGAIGLCDTIGETAYVSVYDPAGGSLDGAGRAIHTRIFVMHFYTSGGTTFIAPNVYQIVRSHLGNTGGIALDDHGSLYFQLADLAGGTGAAIFKATELPRSMCSATNRVNRWIPPFPDTMLELTTTEAAPADVRVTNYSGTATTFGNVMAMTAGPCNTLYAALAPSHENGGAAAGAFGNPAGLGATPSMIISFADAAGAIDACTSPGGMQPGILPIDDGFADVARAGLTLAPGVNNFRVFALGAGPDRRVAGDPVFGSPTDTLQVDFQIDPTIFGGLVVDEERSVYVVSGGSPSGFSGDPSPDRGEILKFPDRAPADRRADFVDLRGDTPPAPPNSGGNGGDGDADRFDFLFWQAPADGGGHPDGIAGLARGFLRYLNRPSATAIPNLPDGTQGDDDADGPVAFSSFDPSEQVAGGDDATAPSTGDDAASGFEFSFGAFQTGMCTTPWTEFFLNSNGNVTFGAGDTDNTPSIPDLLGGRARIAPAWFDTNPAARATAGRSFPVQALGFAGPNAFKIRWIDVPPFGSESCGGVSTFAVTLYDDGTGDDESMPGTPEGPTDQRFRGGIGAPPRGDGRGPVDFEYCRMDVLGDANEPVIAGYSEGGQDPAFPHVCETDLGEAAIAADAAGSGLVGDGSQRVLFEHFKDGVRPAPQVAGKIDFDLRFAGNDPALTTTATQPDPSRDFVSLFGADCSTGADLTCSCALVIDPLTLPGGALYDAQIAAQGGTEPFTYAISGGSLPGGVTLDADGHLAGASTSDGSFNFQVTATDASSCTAQRTYAIDASCAAAATFPSVDCRLDVLSSAAGALPAGKLQKKLTKLLATARKKADQAQTKIAAGKTKPARRLLGQAVKALKKFAKLLDAKTAKKQLADDVRSALIGAAAPIQGDISALQGAL